MGTIGIMFVVFWAFVFVISHIMDMRDRKRYVYAEPMYDCTFKPMKVTVQSFVYYCTWKDGQCFPTERMCVLPFNSMQHDGAWGGFRIIGLSENASHVLVAPVENGVVGSNIGLPLERVIRFQKEGAYAYLFLSLVDPNVRCVMYCCDFEMHCSGLSSMSAQTVRCGCCTQPSIATGAIDIQEACSNFCF